VRVCVPYGDLDLTTSAGAERVLDRLERKAIKACRGQPDIRDLGVVFISQMDRCCQHYRQKRR
jgi:UrcA family protein